MAKVEDVLDYLDELNDFLNRLNNSQSPEETRQLLQGQFNQPNANFGNMQHYIDQISASLDDLYESVATPVVRLAVDGVNQMVSGLYDYLASAWWQFGSGRDNREATVQLPEPPMLM